MSNQVHGNELQNIQDRLNRSRERFIDELMTQEVDAGRRLIDEFLNDQLGPSENRSPIAQQEAGETVQLILGFNSHAASIATKVAIANIAYRQALLSLQTDTIRKGMEQVGRPEGAANFAKFAKDISQRAEQCGEHIDFVQRLAVEVLLAHRSTILEFTAEALDVPWSEVVRRIRRELATSAKSEHFDQSVEQLKEELGTLAKDIAEEYLDGFRKYWRIMRRLLGKKKIPRFGQTDVMQRLLHELRQQERAIAQLELSFSNALEVLQSQASAGDAS